MASDVIAYVAVSLDGYLADDDGLVGFLDDFGSSEYGYDEFFAGVGGLIMGSRTYEQILEWGWPYGETPGLVLTSRRLPAPDEVKITFTAISTGDAIRDYARSVDRRLWIVGGGDVITDALDQGAVDTLEIYVMPTVLGRGVPLFTRALRTGLDLTESQTFSNGVVRLTYSPS